MFWKDRRMLGLNVQSITHRPARQFAQLPNLFGWRWEQSPLYSSRTAMRCFVVAISSLGLAVSAMGAPLVHVLNTNQTIDLVNAANNASVPYGTTIFPSQSLALTPGGALYSADPAGILFNVTGPPIPVGPTGKTQIGDLDYAGNGLWGYSNASSELFFFDLGLSLVTYSQVISLPPAATVTGVAHQASTGDVYLSANNGLNNDFLLRVPSFATSATLIGPMANGDAFSYFADIDFDASGTLYAMSFFHRYFYTVSTTTAATSLVSVGPHKDTTAMALNPVPEPASLAIIGLGLLALAKRRR